MRKPVFGFLMKWTDINLTVQPQMIRGLKFWIKEVDRLYYSCSGNKGADQLHDLRLC